MTMNESPQHPVSWRTLTGRPNAGGFAKAARKLSLLIMGSVLGAVAAWAAPGDLDVRFGVSGIGRTLENFSATAPYGLAVIQQSDGKIVVAGASRTANTMFVARYNTDGGLDTSFSATGVTSVAFANGPGAAYGLLQQPDGKLVITGAGQNNRAGDYDIVLVRMNSDGSPDSSFGTAGIASLTGGGVDEFGVAVIRQSDGKLLVAGTSNANRTYDYEFARFNADGTIDNSFGSSGRLYVDVAGHDDQANAMIQQADGAIVATGFSRDAAGMTNMSVVRLTAAGALDSAFGTGGKLIINFGAQASSASGIAQQLG